MTHTDYLGVVLDPKEFRRRLNKAASKLRQIEFDGIAVTGCSGLTFGAALAARLNKRLIIIRKSSDKRHSYFDVEGSDAIASYIFIDDFVHTGATRKRVLKAMRRFAPKAIYVGGYYYGNHRRDAKFLMPEFEKALYGDPVYTDAEQKAA